MASAKKVGSVGTLGCAVAERESRGDDNAASYVRGSMSKTFFADYLGTTQP
jgi:hypothetical protein